MKQLSKLCFPTKLRLFFFNVAKHKSWLLLLLGWVRKLVNLRGHRISCKLLESETWLQSVAVIMICWTFLLGKGVKLFMVHWSLTSLQKCQEGHVESSPKVWNFLFLSITPLCTRINCTFLSSTHLSTYYRSNTIS